jgi:hypothetical protein
LQEDHPPMTEPGREKYSESTLKLSERYGIDPARLDAILGKPKDVAPSAVEPTREWIEERRIHQPNAEPVVSKQPAVKVVEPNRSSASSATNVHAAKDVRSQGSSLVNGPRPQKTYTYEKQVTSPLTWIIGLVILGILAIMFFMARGCDDKKAQQTQTPTTIVDTVVKTDTLATKDTVAVPVPVPGTAETSKGAPTKPRARRTAGSSSSRNVALSTTSSFAATEKLAELKADGNKNAKIRRVTKNGVTLYQVRTR